jgi:hypothetical protein
MTDPQDQISTDSVRETAEAERPARVQRVDEKRAAEEQKRIAKLEKDRLRQAAYREKQKKIVEAADTEAVARKLKEERAAAAEQLKREREVEIEYELSGGNFDNSPEENAELQVKIDDYLAPVESMPFEDLYIYLSVTSPGRAILKSFGVEPLAPGHFMDSRGIHKYSSQVGRMVQCTDDGSWVYTIADYEVHPKSAATTRSEAKMYSPAIQETKAHDLRIKLELARIKAIEEEKHHREWLRGLEKIYLSKRRESKEKQVREIKTRENAQETI